MSDDVEALIVAFQAGLKDKPERALGLIGLAELVARKITSRAPPRSRAKPSPPRAAIRASWRAPAPCCTACSPAITCR